MELFRSTILVCGGTGCTSSGSMKLYERFEQLLAENGLDKEIKLVRTGCFGLCAAGPVVIVYPEGAFYSHVKLEDVDEIVSEHLVKGRVVQRLLYKDSADEETRKIKPLDEINFYGKQKRVALRNCGVIDPENIDEYIAFNGYKALAKVLTEMSREDVVDTVLKSGLRGRGGGGFPTGLKWKFAMPSTGKKYVCCNADEGDPGAFMDRSVLEGDPHCVLEAMAIAGYAIGSDEGYIYVRAEYPIAVKRLEIAIEQAHEYGLLGNNIFGTGFNFDVHIRLGAGAFVCGEETALMNSIEGMRGEPRPRPPFPAVKGLLKPTPTSRRSSSTAQTGSPPWAPRSPRAPRSSRWAERSTTRVWSRFPWAPPCARSSTTSAAAAPTARPSRPCRPAVPPADASRPPCWTPRSTTTT